MIYDAGSGIRNATKLALFASIVREPGENATDICNQMSMLTVVRLEENTISPVDMQ